MENEIGGNRSRPARKKKTPHPQEEGWEWAVSSYAS